MWSSHPSTVSTNQIVSFCCHSVFWHVSQLACPAKLCVYMYCMWEWTCVFANTERIQPAKCVCVCLCLDLVCVFLLWGQWKLMTACCLIKQFHIPTHTCTSQYTLKNTHNHESLHKYTNTVHTPSLSWHQSRLADFLNSTNEIKKVLLKSSYSVKFCLKNLKSFINFDLAVEATGIFLFNSILFT